MLMFKKLFHAAQKNTQRRRYCRVMVLSWAIKHFDIQKLACLWLPRKMVNHGGIHESKMAGRGHGQGHNWWPHLRPSVQSVSLIYSFVPAKTQCNKNVIITSKRICRGWVVVCRFFLDIASLPRHRKFLQKHPLQWGNFGQVISVA